MKRALRGAWPVFLAAWLLATPFMGGGSFRSPAAAARDLAECGGIAGAAAYAALALAAAAALWAAAAAVSRLRPPGPAADVLSSAAVLVPHLLHALAFAASAAYFTGYPWWAWASSAAALGRNAHALVRLIALAERRDAAFAEYRAFRERTERGVRRGGIQRRLTAVFASLLIAVVVLLSYVLISGFGDALLSAVTDNGAALAERSATAVKTNAPDRIAVEDYFAAEERKNEGAAFPFRSLTYYRRDPNTGAYAAEASTFPLGAASALPAGYPAPESPRTFREEGTTAFEAPVELGGKTIGFVSVRYEDQIIYGPYVRALVKAALVSFLFVYASLFLAYLIGRGIVAPILFLGMSVNALATRLQGMAAGTERVSADALRYEDRVSSRDEIKRLSGEISHMASVIRGVVPYISASAFKHSGRAGAASERRELAFLFTDIRGFTAFCEGRSPEEVVSLLNRYLELQTEAIARHGGEIDKFIGDGIMAMFDGPEKEINACRAGMAIRAAMAEERERARKAGAAVVSVGMGVNAGPVVFGAVGARERRDFTSVGETVNLAARLEGANKTYGTKALISEPVFSAVRDAFVCREIDLITVKGTTRPVRIYELLQEYRTAGTRPKEIARSFEAALAAYRKRDWREAEERFGCIAEAFADEPSAVFARRAALFGRTPPPPDWDGVFAMTVK